MVHYSEIVTWMPFILLFKVWPKCKEINATPQTIQVSVTFNLHPLDTESANWTLQPHYPTAVAVKGFHLLQGYCIWLHHTVNCSYYFVYTQYVIKTFHFCKWSVQLTLCANEKALWFCVYQCVVAYMCSLACLLMVYPVLYHMFTHLLAYAFVCVFVDTFCSRADRLNSPYKRPVPWPFIMHTHSHTNTQIVLYPHTTFHTHIHPLVWSSLVFQVVQQCAAATLKWKAGGQKSGNRFWLTLQE